MAAVHRREHLAIGRSIVETAWSGNDHLDDVQAGVALVFVDAQLDRRQLAVVAPPVPRDSLALVDRGDEDFANGSVVVDDAAAPARPHVEFDRRAEPLREFARIADRGPRRVDRGVEIDHLLEAGGRRDSSSRCSVGVVAIGVRMNATYQLRMGVSAP